MLGAHYLFPCPICGSKQGQWCTERTSEGERYFTTPHDERKFPRKEAQPRPHCEH